MRNSRSGAREARYLAEGCIWIFRVDRTWSRDAAVNGSIAQFINHSCTPNCWFEVVDKTIWIRASRAIRAGEELTYVSGPKAITRFLYLPARLQDLALIVATLRAWQAACLFAGSSSTRVAARAVRFRAA